MDQKTGDIMGNVEMESDEGGVSSALPLGQPPPPPSSPSVRGARPASQKLLPVVLGESFSGSVVVSEGLGRSEEEELQSALVACSATGDKNAIPPPTPLLW